MQAGQVPVLAATAPVGGTAVVAVPVQRLATSPARPDRLLNLALALASITHLMAIYALFALLALCSAQPLFFASTLCGGGSGTANGVGTNAQFNGLTSLSFWNASSSLLVGDAGNRKLRQVFMNGTVRTLLGGGASGSQLGNVNGVGTAALFGFLYHGIADALGNIYAADATHMTLRMAYPNLTTVTLSSAFNSPNGMNFDNSGSLVMPNKGTHQIYRVSGIPSSFSLAVVAGSGIQGYADGAALSARFFNPVAAVVNSSDNSIFVVDQANNLIRRIAASVVSTFAGGGGTIAAGFSNGIGTAATFNWPFGATLWSNVLFVADLNNNAIRAVSADKIVSTIAGTGIAGASNGMALLATFFRPQGITSDLHGNLFVADNSNNLVRRLTPCTQGAYMTSNGPVICPSGSFCPLCSTNWTLCPAGTFASAAGSTSCQQCPGRGNYCPDGSGAPKPCPYQVPPSGGWGALQVQGPAFHVETASCLNHCFWNFTSGDGVLSKC